MEKKPDILLLGLPKWEGDYQKSTVEIAKELSAHHRVVYVEYTPTWKDTRGPSSGNLREITTPEGHAMWVYTPPSLLPINWIQSKMGYDLGLSINAWILRRALRTVLKQLGFSHFLVINAFQPALGCKLLDTLGERATFYYAYDEISAADWLKVHGPRYEIQFLQRVHGAIVTSAGLLASKKRYQPHIALVTNGVETTLFDTKRYTYSPKPILGYIGALDDRLDAGLLRLIAKSFPEYTLQLIGKVSHPPLQNALAGLSNIEWVGPVPPDSIGSYLQHFQVGLIPFVTNDFTRNIYPMKINQYLAMGMPVVSTNFADLTSFGDLIQVRNTPKDILESIYAALMEASPDLRLARRIHAWENAWPQKAIQFSNFITS